MRTAEKSRCTKETNIKMSLTLDAEKGGLSGSSGIGFFDHMLNSFCVHGGFNVNLEMTGDLHVDGHHSVEDAGIVLGSLFAEILKGAFKLFVVNIFLNFHSGDIADEPVAHFHKIRIVRVQRQKFVGNRQSFAVTLYFKRIIEACGQFGAGNRRIGGFIFGAAANKQHNCEKRYDQTVKHSVNILDFILCNNIQ